MSPVESPMSRTALRGGYVEWMSRPEFTHAVTLAPNRFERVSYELLTKMFGSFSYEVDRYVLDIKHPYLRNSHDRFQMVAMPEKVGINAHLHGVANFSPAFMGDRLHQDWETKLDNIWRAVTRGSGETHITDDFDRGLLRYFTKEAVRSGHDYLHSWDFHRDDKLRKRPNATTLHTVAPKKAVLNS